MFLFFAMYVVYLGMGYTLMCKTMKSGTIKCYITDAMAQVQKQCQTYLHNHPSATLSWISPIQMHGDNKMAPEITKCLQEINHWEI